LIFLSYIDIINIGINIATNTYCVVTNAPELFKFITESRINDFRILFFNLKNMKKPIVYRKIAKTPK